MCVNVTVSFTIKLKNKTYLNAKINSLALSFPFVLNKEEKDNLKCETWSTKNVIWFKIKTFSMLMLLTVERPLV